MLFIKNYFLKKIIPIIRNEWYRIESSILLESKIVVEVLSFLKNHITTQYKNLICISGVDYPENLHRFTIVYELLSIKFNSRFRVKIMSDELTPVTSAEGVFPSAAWWECEIWDMFGVFFENHGNLVRLLTDYGFKGHPLRKDFPLMGFIESRYNVVKNQVVYENLELAQEYRVFNYSTPWDKRD